MCTYLNSYVLERFKETIFKGTQGIINIVGRWSLLLSIVFHKCRSFIKMLIDGWRKREYDGQTDVSGGIEIKISGLRMILHWNFTVRLILFTAPLVINGGLCLVILLYFKGCNAMPLVCSSLHIRWQQSSFSRDIWWKLVDLPTMKFKNNLE